jgi:hypothetical protein
MINKLAVFSSKWPNSGVEVSININPKTNKPFLKASFITKTHKDPKRPYTYSNKQLTEKQMTKEIAGKIGWYTPTLSFAPDDDLIIKTAYAMIEVQKKWKAESQDGPQDTSQTGEEVAIQEAKKEIEEEEVSKEEENLFNEMFGKK